MEIMTMVATTSHREVELPFDVPAERLGEDHVVRNEGSPLSYEVQTLFEQQERAESEFLRRLEERMSRIAVSDTVSEPRLEAFAS